MTTATKQNSVITENHEQIGAIDALASLKKRISETIKKGEKPVIVYDLDGTLFDNRSRVMKILADTLMTPEGQKLDREILEKVSNISARNMVYAIKDTLRNHGIEDEEVLEFFFKNWFDRFFTNEYVVFDVPTPGAKQFVETLYNSGVVSIYLTGRDTPGMRPGTERSLSMHEFPAPRGEMTHLITKSTFEQPDTDYKIESIDTIKAMGTVVGIFDNEPKPMNILARAFPEAESYFLDTLHSNDFEILEDGIKIMKNFVLPA